jgi:hypothetical protein
MSLAQSLKCFAGSHHCREVFDYQVDGPTLRRRRAPQVRVVATGFQLSGRVLL